MAPTDVKAEVGVSVGPLPDVDADGTRRASVRGRHARHAGPARRGDGRRGRPAACERRVQERALRARVRARAERRLARGAHPPRGRGTAPAGFDGAAAEAGRRRRHDRTPAPRGTAGVLPVRRAASGGGGAGGGRGADAGRVRPGRVQERVATRAAAGSHRRPRVPASAGCSTPPSPGAACLASRRTWPARWPTSPATCSRRASSPSAPRRSSPTRASAWRSSASRRSKPSAWACCSASRGAATSRRGCIVLRHEPPEADGRPVLGLVGKGITFDTGGISLKPAYGHGADEGRHGGRRRGDLRHARPVAPRCADPGRRGRAARRRTCPAAARSSRATCCAARAGKTVEVVNTDAEGRLILGDALWYARQQGRRI